MSKKGSHLVNPIYRFCSYIDLILTNFRARIIQGGHTTDFFQLQRGARQGDPLASLLFIMYVEILLEKFRSLEIVDFYEVGNVSVPLVAYADDINVFIKYCARSLREVMRILEDFRGILGLTVQVAKTQAVLLGAVYQETDRLCNDINIRWDQNFKLLGINFNGGSTRISAENYLDKLKDIKSELKHWKTRALTPIGRANVLNGLHLSKLTHIATVLMSLCESEIDKTEAELYDFIWRGPSPMARDEAKMPKHMGGIGFPCLRATWTSVKVSWIRRITNSSP
ncbi:MAG: hypothetical protein GY696_04170, partial [Gammaproteobacteria bacterium]|nr:hypothetical protein [Gammaproteobacteria bacterium]